MAENTDIEDQVDLDDEYYCEEDDDIEELMEGVNDGEGDEENGGEEQEDMRKWDCRKIQSPERYRSNDRNERVEYEGKPGAKIKGGKKEKHTELLALPPHGSEVFIGGLSQNISEEDLRELCKPFGEIFEIRLMKNRDTGESKGFAFVAFKTKDVAQKAIEELHSKEFKGRALRCSVSDAKYKLFIGNVPKSWSDDDFKEVIEDIGPGVETIELIKDPQNPGCNRGFSFVEYFNNACADYSRLKMLTADFRLDGNKPTVTWAEPQMTPNHSSAAAQVKALYVKYIPENTPIEQLKSLFQRHGEVTKVVMPPSKCGGKRDFGFVHYAERSSALKAIENTETYEINGQVLAVVLAKPQMQKKFNVANPQNSTPVSNNNNHLGYAGIPVSPYASIAAGYGAAPGFQQQPMNYGRGPMPEGMQMVPMVLSDGRIGYVLQQPGIQIPQVRPWMNDKGIVAPGTHSSNDDSNHKRRYRPY
ncbi:heterogeneous nuclear ribonucleoprotein Q-like isoform X1 [Olea europaea var. sylvestris]|uniref:heterogeneous nuclear ribonucleoprotein Q-like isoform X1 n=1 Tax=Olea europaea var. sylvestris TaxID=158386 RepID=UPI000C1CFCBD|nr:heterogeneous nuclear ribonucleoprotein Q-like isoform X1 [Olea europaea var. sylvestris]